MEIIGEGDIQAQSTFFSRSTEIASKPLAQGKEQSVFPLISSDAPAFSVSAKAHICPFNWFLVTVND